MLDGGGREPPDLFLARHVAGNDESVAAPSADALGHRLAGLGLAAGHDDPRAEIRHALRDGAPDAPARAGDDGDFISEIEGRCHGPAAWCAWRVRAWRRFPDALRPVRRRGVGRE